MAPKDPCRDYDQEDLRDCERVHSVKEGVVHDRIRFGRESGLDPVERRTCVEEIQYAQNHLSATKQNHLLECLCDVRHVILQNVLGTMILEPPLLSKERAGGEVSHENSDSTNHFAISEDCATELRENG